jgi:hypothetical protein
MSVALYHDEHVHGILARALTQRGVDVITVQQDGYGAAEDSAVFERAMALGRVLVSSDSDMLDIAAAYWSEGRHFNGLLYLRRATIRQHLESLEYVGTTVEPHELFNTVLRLPL